MDFASTINALLSKQQFRSTCQDLSLLGFLFHIMAYFYVIYRYVISEWRLIRPMEINQYDITMNTHYDITMVMMILGMRIVKSHWVMMLLGISFVKSQ